MLDGLLQPSWRIWRTKISSNRDTKILTLGQDEESVELWDEVKNCAVHFLHLNYVFGILTF